MRRLAKISIRTGLIELVLSPNALRMHEDGEEMVLERGLFGTAPHADEVAEANIIYADD